MKKYWWQDVTDRDNNWMGLEIVIQPDVKTRPLMEMVSGHHGRSALMVRGEALYWSAMLKNHSGTWLVFNSDHPAQENLLPPVTSADVETCARAGGDGIAWWCRYFARQLLAETPQLQARRWLIQPLLYSGSGRDADFRKWCFSSPQSHNFAGGGRQLSGEEFPDLGSPQKIQPVDWWWRGDLLLGRYAISKESGRLKWWRKKAREGTLPPVLLWYACGFSSFIILDGHYRLQAALAEGVPPRFLVLSELAERMIPEDPVQRERVEKSLLLQLKRNPSVDPRSFNQLLIGMYDRRCYFTPGHSRAVLGKGEQWLRQVSDYLQRHQLADFLPYIVAREARQADE